MHMRNDHSRPGRPAGAALVGAAALLLACSGAVTTAPAPAHAAAGRTIRFSELDSDEPASGIRLGQLEIDSSAGRGYLLDRPSEDLLVYDITGSGLTFLARIDLGSEPTDVAVNGVTHQVFVSDAVDDTVTWIDGRPGSATVNTVVGIVPTGGAGGAAVAADTGFNLVYVANPRSSDVSRIDVATRKVIRIALPSPPDDLVTKPGSSTVWIASRAASTLTILNGVAPSAPVAVGAVPIALAAGSGGIQVATQTATAPLDYRVKSYTGSLDPIATSPSLAAPVTSMASDPSIHSIFATTSSGQPYALRLSDLRIEGDAATPPAGISSVAVDDATRRVYTTTSALRGGSVSVYEMTAGAAILPTTNPTATVGSPFAYPITAMGRPVTMTFGLVSGALPPGITLSSTGTLTGIPTTAGPYRFAVSATNGLGAADVALLGITVLPAPPAAPVITSPAPPNGSVGSRYPSTTFTASGNPSAVFSIGAGTLPPGLSLDERTSEVYGTPTVAGSYRFTVTADNGVGTDSRVYTVVIAPAPGSVPRITSGPPANGTVGVTYPSLTVTAIGTPPPGLSVTTGILPPGLTFDERTAVLSGTPTKAGTYPFTLTADNGLGKDSREYMVVIAPVGPTPEPTATPTPSVTPIPSPSVTPPSSSPPTTEGTDANGGGRNGAGTDATRTLGSGGSAGSGSAGSGSTAGAPGRLASTGSGTETVRAVALSAGILLGGAVAIAVARRHREA